MYTGCAGLTVDSLGLRKEKNWKGFVDSIFKSMKRRSRYSGFGEFIPEWNHNRSEEVSA
jgi:hypothetical protein